MECKKCGCLQEDVTTCRRCGDDLISNKLHVPHKIDYKFAENVTLRFKVKEGCDRSGEEGEYFGYVCVNNMKWGIVLFDGEEDPDLYKAAYLLLEQKSWVDLTHSCLY